MTTGPPDDTKLFARIDALKKRRPVPAEPGPTKQSPDERGGAGGQAGREENAAPRRPPPPRAVAARAASCPPPPAEPSPPLSARRGRPANPATAARAALRRAAKPVWTNFGFAATVLEARLRSDGLAAAAETIRADPAAIARPRQGAGEPARERVVEALGRLARHVETAPDPAPDAPVFARMLNDPPNT